MKGKEAGTIQHSSLTIAYPLDPPGSPPSASGQTQSPKGGLIIVVLVAGKKTSVNVIDRSDGVTILLACIPELLS